MITAASLLLSNSAPSGSGDASGDAAADGAFANLLEDETLAMDASPEPAANTGLLAPTPQAQQVSSIPAPGAGTNFAFNLGLLAGAEGAGDQSAASVVQDQLHLQPGAAHNPSLNLALNLGLLAGAEAATGASADAAATDAATASAMMTNTPAAQLLAATGLKTIMASGEAASAFLESEDAASVLATDPAAGPGVSDVALPALTTASAQAPATTITTTAQSPAADAAVSPALAPAPDAGVPEAGAETPAEASAGDAGAADTTQAAEPGSTTAPPASAARTTESLAKAAAAATDAAPTARIDAAATQTPAPAADAASAARAPASDGARLAQTSPALQSAPQATLQVYASMVDRFDGRAQRFEVRLDPAELGRVDVRIEIGADRKVHAVLAAHDSAALTDLMRGQRSLERALADAGIDLADGGVSFELAPDSGRGSTAGQDQSGGRSSPPSHVWRRFDAIELAADAETVGASRPWRPVRLDLVA